MARLAALAFWGGAALAEAAPALAGVVCALAAREVVYLSPHSPEMVDANRALWTPGEPVAELYGAPQGRRRILFADRTKIVVPEEDPSLTLLRVDKQAGDNPLQWQTVWFGVQWAVAAGVAAGAAGGGLLFALAVLKRICEPRPRCRATGA